MRDPLKERAAPEKRAVRRSFERAAASYDAHAVLHREIASRLLEHLDPIRIDPQRVLDLGCGTGAAMGALRARFPRAQVVGIDIALAMLRAASKRVPAWRRWLGARAQGLACADAERLPLAASTVDFAFSNLALQWCDAPTLLAEVARVLPPGGLFLFSTFGPDTLKELRTAFSAAGDGDAHVHAFTDMHDVGDALVHAGFADPVMEMEMLSLEYASVEALARDLKAVGARNALASRARGLYGRNRWARVAAAYEASRRAGALPASYEVIYGHAWKTGPRRRADGRQVIDVHRPARP